MKKILLTISLLLLFVNCLIAQMIVSPNVPAALLVDRLVGAGVTYTNPVLTCPTNASGKFDNAILTTLQMDSGVVLTSGSAINTSMPASFFSSVNNAIVGNEPNLQAVATGTIYDRCKLEFDFIPIGDTVRFNYRFGSEEYPSYTCSNFNDVFSFFISGPGYAGPTNVALIPGTNCPVSINTVNGSNQNPCGQVVAPCAPPNNALFINNAFGTSVVYDGLTQKIMAVAAVTPCSTYHMKFAIADVYDGILDSGVFLEANSFSSEAATITNIVSTNLIPAANPFAIEDCNPAVITISRPNPKPYPQTIQLVFSGTATNGVDFPLVPNTITIPANATSTSININAIQDNLPEGIETFTIYVYGTVCLNTITDSITINILEYPHFVVSPNDTICAGQTVNMTVQTVPLNNYMVFNWSPPAQVFPNFGNNVNANPTVNTTYTVSATYPGCSVVDSTITIFVEPTPTITLTVTPISCNGLNDGGITATGAVTYNPLTFNLQPNNITQNGSPSVFNNLGAGTYTVTITSAIGCTFSATTNIVNPPPMNWANLTITDIPCNGGNIGVINAQANGGNPTYTYLLMPGAINNVNGIFNNLAPGTYTITASDMNGCSISTIATINQPIGPTITNISFTNPTCLLPNSGTITVSASGIGTINYTLNPGAIVNQNGIFTGLASGIYTIQIVDATLCSATSVVNILFPNSPTVTLTSSAILCNGGVSNITVNVSGGQAAYQYSLNGGANQALNVFNNVIAGIYTVLVTDANGCTGSNTLQITEPPILDLMISGVQNPSCIPGNDGSITVTASGGTAGYQYSLNGGGNQVSNIFSGIGAGAYTIVVMDANGCSASISTILTAPNAPVISGVISNDVLCNGGNDGSITVIATGGNGALSYQLQLGNIVNGTGVYNNLVSGSYTVTVTDALGCSISTVVIINEPILMNWTANTVVNVSCNGGNDGSITIAASGGTGAINYTLLPPNIVNGTGFFGNLVTGNYTVIGTDANGCSISVSIQIQEPNPIQVTLTSSAILCNGGVSNITVNVSGGQAAYQYSLNGGANQALNVFNNVIAGIYTVLVTDANGCTGSNTLQITEPPILDLMISGVQNPSCIPGNDGSITVTASGGTAGYQYSLNGGGNQVSNIFSGIGAGAYTIVVMDANGCSASISTILTAPNAPVISGVTSNDVLCNGGNDGSITVIATGGNGALSYQLQLGNIVNGTGVYNNLVSGSYTVTVTDALGCSISTVVIINEPILMNWTANTVVNVSCNGGNDGSITIAASGGTGAINYTLLPPNIVNGTGFFGNLVTGNYTVIGTDANGCSISVSIQIQEPNPIQVTLTSSAILCNGGVSNITVNVSGGQAAYQYSLNGGANQALNVFNNVIAGIYTVLVTDANGCTGSNTLQITEPPILDLMISGVQNPSCIPGNDGSITVTASGGTAGYQYSLNGGGNQVSNIFSGIGAGAYTIVVMDANGCSASISTILTAPNAPVISGVTSNDVLCNGGNDGSITVIATGGNGALSYQLQLGNIVNGTGVYNNLVSGSYTVTVTDALGCSISTVVIINEPILMNWTANTVVNVSCNGGNDGSITIAASGGTGAINYTLLPPNIVNGTGFFGNLVTGNYTVIGTDANGCSISVSIQIQEPNPIQVTLTSSAILCNGGVSNITVNVSGGQAAYQYSLNGGANQALNVFNNVIAGIYTVLVTDANGCTGSNTLQITEPPILDLMISGVQNPSCIPGNDGSITVTASGGTAGYQYSLNGGGNQVSNIFSGIGAGAYTIVVMDANGCSASISTILTAPNAPVISGVTSNDVLCNGGNDGSITVIATGGNGALSYQLQLGNIVNGTGVYNNLVSGSYTVTVTDALGCSISTVVIINEPILMNWTANTVVNVSCNGGNDGSITIAASGGTGAINYTLLPPNIVNGTGFFGNLVTGNYTVIGTDANGCSISVSIQIQEPNPIQVTLTSSAILCNGGVSNITVNVSGGQAAYQYSLNGGANQALNVFNNVIAGIYTVLVTDANGCTGSNTLQITEPPILDLMISGVQNPSCIPGNDGSITVTASGGTAGYQYSLNGGGNQVSNIFSGIGAGAYTIVVMDANGCSASISTILTAPNAPVISGVTSNDVLCNGGNDGSITVIATGGNGALSYQLQLGNIVNGTGVYNNLVSGSYTVTVTDALGCSISTVVIINEPILMNWTANTVVNVSCNGGNDGSITIAASGGTGAINYTLLPPNIVNGTGFFGNLVTGNYTVIGTDANGCSISVSIQIQEPNPIQVTLTSSAILCNGGVSNITVNVSGGQAAYQYSLNGGANQALNVFNNVIAGIYTVLVTDANGCTGSNTLQITEPPILDLMISGVQNPSCIPGNDGSITVTASGGTAGYQYSLNGGGNQVSNIFSGIGAGAYTIVVMDANGCSASISTILTAPNAPVISGVTSNDVLCNGGNDGSITVIATGGNGALSYQLQLGNIVNGTGVYNNLVSGSYTVTVTDALGCSISTVVIINEPILMNWTANTVVNVSCNGGNDGSITIAASGGTGAINYTLLPPNIVNGTGFFGNLVTGNYTVIGTDANGCSISVSIQIQEPNPIQVTLTSSAILCNGGVSNITVNVSGGQAAYQYSLNGGANQALNVFNNVIAGIYTVLVTDANGCTGSNTLQITEPPILDLMISGVQNPSCIPGNDGSITVTASGGTAGYQYSLNGGGNQVSNIFSGIGAGAYTIVVMDANGCSASISTILTAPNAPVISGVTSNDVLCNGGNDGSITVIATGGNGALSYQLQLGNIVNGTGVYNNLVSGSYTVTVTDALGCSISTVVIINEPILMNWTANTVVNVSCNGGNDGSITIAASGGTGAINYTLLPPNIVNGTGFFGNLVTGNYTVIGTDANGCSISVSIQIQEPNPIQVTLTPSAILCNGGVSNITVNVSGGQAAYQYSLNGGANQALNVFNNVIAGIYTVLVTDANGCTGSNTLQITEPPILDLMISGVQNPSCIPGNDGSITVTASGGTAGYQYSLNGGGNQVSNIFSGIGAGAYTIVVMDANGCSASISTILTAPNAPVISGVTSSIASCVPGCDATINISATGGNGMLNYSIDNLNFQLSNIFNNVCAGTFTVTVTDALGCTSTSVIDVLTSNTPVITVNSIIDVNCFGGNDGSIDVTANGGTSPYNYNLQPININNVTGQFFTLTANTYIIIVTDAMGCTALSNVPINEPQPLLFGNVNINNVLCFGANNADLTINTTGGTGMVNFVISPNANFIPPNVFNNLIGNTVYTITATDANGCTVSTTVLITEPTPLQIVSVSNTNVNCYNAADATIDIVAQGGTGILNYNLLPLGINNNNGNFNNLPANIYTITVMDANACSISTTVLITEPSPIVLNSINVVDISCNNFNNGQIDINCSGGTGLITYTLLPSNIINVNGFFNNLASNTYTVLATDANGCTYETIVLINNPNPIVISTTQVTDVLCFANATGEILLTANGGTGNLNYLLQPNNLNNNNGQFTGLLAGTYTVVISDANQCSISTIIQIIEPPLLTILATQIQGVSCYNGTNGEVATLASGGATPYSYNIVPINLVNATGLFNNLAAGTYTVMVTDANGCTANTSPLVVTEPPAIKIDNISKQDIICNGDATGIINVAASGGTGNINFQISPLVGLQNAPGQFTQLTAGVYTITITDANNCTLTTFITLLENPEIIISDVSYVSPICYGDATGIINVKANGGVGQLTFLLDNQITNTNGFFNQLYGGIHTLLITDDLGCSIDTSLLLTQPEKLDANIVTTPVYCKGYSDGTLQATATGGNGGYTYYLKPGINLNKHGFFKELHEGLYELHIKDSMGCEMDTAVYISPPLSPLGIVVTKQNLSCYGTGMEGWAHANISGGNAPFSIVWSTNPPQTTPKAVGLPFGFYSVEVTDARGCVEKDSVYIEPGPCCDEIFIPNAFSPNGDGNNDIFRVLTTAGIELYQFEIYDRWGLKLWTTNDFREGWDGTYMAKDCDMNTYYYIFRYTCTSDGNKYIKKGDISLIR